MPADSVRFLVFLKSLQTWRHALLLGLATIGAYGTVSYSVGVFLPVIVSDTAWSTAAVAAGVSLGILGQGAAAVFAGRVLDTHGSSAVFVPALAGGSFVLLLASVATESWQFVALWSLGASVIGGAFFYNVTMPVASRLYPTDRAAALSALTLLGALASPVFYPLAGLLIEQWGWRQALQGLVVLSVACATPAALFARVPGTLQVSEGKPSASLLACLKDPAVYRLLVVIALIGFAHTALLLNQVPVMKAAGLSLSAAAWFAGARGFFQIPGRMLLAPLTSRFGVRGTMYLCYGSAVTAGLALLLALQGSLATVFVFYFCAVGGMSLGLRSPLTGLLQAEVFGNARLGSLTGIATLLASLASATGALLSGLLVDLTGSYGTALVLVIGAYALTLLAFHWQGRGQRGSVVEGAVVPM